MSLWCQRPVLYPYRFVVLEKSLDMKGVCMCKAMKEYGKRIATREKEELALNLNEEERNSLMDDK